MTPRAILRDPQGSLFAPGSAGVERPAHVGQETSMAAADAIAAHAATLRHQVLVYLLKRGPLGATDEEIVAALGLRENTERPRRRELVQAGQVEDSRQRRITRSGRDAIVWRAVALLEERG